MHRRDRLVRGGRSLTFEQLDKARSENHKVSEAPNVERMPCSLSTSRQNQTGRRLLGNVSAPVSD